MNRIVAALCALLAIGALAGGGALPGAEAATAVRSWWTARAYEQAAIQLDWPQMARLGRQLLADTNDGGPLEYATQRMGVDGTARTQGRVDADVLAWAGMCVLAIEDAVPIAPDPWSGAQLQAFVLVSRILPVTGDAQDRDDGLRVFRRWLAAGGGAVRPSPDATATYQRILRLPAEQRDAALLAILQAGG